MTWIEYLNHKYLFIQLCDRPDVVEDKVLYLARLLRASRRTLLYTGPGLAAGAKTTAAAPRPAHLVLAALVSRGLAAAWVQVELCSAPSVPQPFFTITEEALLGPSPG